MKTLNSFLILIIAAAGIWLAFDDPAPLPTDNLPSPQFKDTVAADTVEWERPRFDQRKSERRKMVEQGIENRGIIDDQKVLDAMRHVPRHFFVPKNHQEYAYDNRPLPIGYDQTISQPLIVAYMTDLLDIESGEKVLEIGTGSGYQAAVLSELTPHVYTIEIVKPLGDQAIKRFEILGYDTIQTKIGDGYKGWPKHAPFEAIILTAAPEDIPQPLIDQLAPEGVLVAPVGNVNENQVLTKITKTKDGEITREQKMPVRFVPMTGKSQKQ
ncbi:protein-L-isoaspartate O-methyltransferase [Aliifodinibius salipaludis]|uniref:Protein-L-isoaspartate O-methyltransferase n=1 Tax=Fodinibius salipaludis TaxID=2032627 RepID=A0A2A2GEU8_9BACT|nr:protein-L-isoaspartate(D-aspartate) O-methyltransferase [Aliifodinibius salipaludis]PAU95888.1 protein-L-isoaspartate O-methyltransferase [Aliifodinibius salipaludis]